MQNKKKITIFLPDLGGGGAEKQKVVLANGLAEDNFIVDFVLGDKTGPCLEKLSDKVTIIDLKTRNMFICLFRLISYLKKNNPDVILSALEKSNVVAVFANLLTRKRARCVICICTTLSESFKRHPLFKRLFMYSCTRFFYPLADAVVSVSKGVAKDAADYLHINPSKITPIYNYHPFEENEQRSLEPIEHPWFSDERDIPTILAMGRLVEAKDFPTLLSAFSLLRNKMEARLVILGEGELRQPLEKLVVELKLGESVALPGFFANPFPYFKRCDLFVLSSQFEGLANALVEALFLSPRIVSTDCPHGSREVLGVAHQDRLVEVGNVEALAKAMGDALGQPPMRVDQSHFDKFRKDTVVSQYLNILC